MQGVSSSIKKVNKNGFELMKQFECANENYELSLFSSNQAKIRIIRVWLNGSLTVFESFE